MEAPVAIIGAGPAGLVLERLLHAAGIEAVVLEAASRAHCEQRMRAGLLEPGTVDVLSALGLDRAQREGVHHDALQLHFRGERHRIAVGELTGRRSTIYPQQEMVKDLLGAGDATGARILFDVGEVALHDLLTATPRVSFVHDGRKRELRCSWLAGCDGFYGACRQAIPDGVLRTYESTQQTTLLGVLADVAPSTQELVYGLGVDGFAMHSMRSASLTRLYLQYDPALDSVDSWPPSRIWDVMRSRLAVGEVGWDQLEGPVLDTSSFSIRAFLAEPMRYGRLLLAGDAAHIVPPTGGKGLNAAVYDATLLSEALVEHADSGSTRLLDAYSATALKRAWAMLQFSVWMTEVLCVRRPGDPFELRLKYAELEQLCQGGALTRSFAERYVGIF